MPAQLSPVPATKRTATGLTVEVVTSREAFFSLERAWIELARQAALNDYFCSWEWAESWWRAYGKPYDLAVLMCRDRAGEVVGIAPLYRTTLRREPGLQVRSLRLIGDGSDDADGFGFLATPSYEREVVGAMLDRLASNASEWDLLELNSMAEESVCARELLTQIRERGWAWQMQWTPHLIVELPDTWEEYLRGLSAKVRQTWLRKIRRAEKGFALTLRHSTPADAVDDLETVIALHEKSWRARGLTGKFGSKTRREFYRMITTRAALSGALDLWLLEANGIACAARLGFLAGNTRHAVLAGMDPEFAHYGVGTIAEAMLLKRSIASGVKIYDFLGGEDAYKLECGATHRRLMNLRTARPRTRAAFWLGATSSVREGKEWLRTNMPSAFNVLKRASGKKR